jgi:hypothetical protein
MVERNAAFPAYLPEAAETLGYAYLHFEDSGDIDRAGVYLDRAKHARKNEEYDTRELPYECAFFEAYYRRNEAEARRWFEAAPHHRDSVNYWRARTALLALTGDQDAARDSWRRGSTLASDVPATGVNSVMRRHFDSLREWIDQGSTALNPRAEVRSGQGRANG